MPLPLHLPYKECEAPECSIVPGTRREKPTCLQYLPYPVVATKKSKACSNTKHSVFFLGKLWFGSKLWKRIKILQWICSSTIFEGREKKKQIWPLPSFHVSAYTAFICIPAKVHSIRGHKAMVMVLWSWASSKVDQNYGPILSQALHVASFGALLPFPLRASLLPIFFAILLPWALFVLPARFTQIADLFIVKKWYPRLYRSRWMDFPCMLLWRHALF